MADEQHPTTTGTDDGPAAGGGPGPRRWLRWGSVLVDIEPPQAPNPWTTAGWGTPGAAPAPAGPGTDPEPGRSRRNLVLFAMAAVASMVLGAVLVAIFARDDDRPVLAVATTTTRPAVTATSPTTSPTAVPTTAPAAVTTAPSRPNRPPAPATTGAPTPGGPITVPEGVPATPPSTVPPTTVPPSTVPPTTSVPAGPVAFLGVTVEESDEGPRIVEVLPGTGAEGAGLLPLDVVTTVDSTPVATTDELGAAIQSHEPGDSITVTVLRNGATVTVRATLGQR